MGTAAVSASWIGSRTPRRSSTRPTTGETPVSRAAPTSQTAPIAAAPQPAAARCSGASVERTPKRKRRQRHEQEPADEQGVAQRAPHRRQGGLVGWDRVDPQRPDGEHHREAGERREDDVSADQRRRCSHGRPEAARRTRRRPWRSRSPRRGARRGVAASSHAKAPAQVKRAAALPAGSARLRAARSRGRRRSRGSRAPSASGRRARLAARRVARPRLLPAVHRRARRPRRRRRARRPPPSRGGIRARSGGGAA